MQHYKHIAPNPGGFFVICNKLIKKLFRSTSVKSSSVTIIINTRHGRDIHDTHIPLCIIYSTHVLP